jgi:hypothetical protein
MDMDEQHVVWPQVGDESSVRTEEDAGPASSRSRRLSRLPKDDMIELVMVTTPVDKV